MAFLWQHPKSKYFMARFIDRSGRRRNRSTKIEAKDANRKKAQKIADAFEDAANRLRTARHARQVIASLHAELTGEDMPTTSLRRHVEDWLARKKPEVSDSTMLLYTLATGGFMESLGKKADDDIASVTGADIVRFRNELAKRVSPSTTNLRVKALRMLFKAAVRDGLLSESPAQHVDTLKKEGGRAARRAFTVEELRAIIAEADTEWQSMIRFGLYTGQRLADIASLTWENIDTTRKEIRLVTRKTDRPMVIPMAEALADHVAGLKAADDPASPLHPAAFELVKEGKGTTLSNRFSDLLASVGLRKPVSRRKDPAKGGRRGTRESSVLSFHSLRATAVTLLHDAGVPSAVVQELIGHESEAVHRVYVKIGRESLRGGTSKLPKL